MSLYTDTQYLINIDTQIINYIKTIITPQVRNRQSGEVDNIPVLWKTGDLSVMSKVLELNKDKSGKIIFPIIYITRNTETITLPYNIYEDDYTINYNVKASDVVYSKTVKDLRFVNIPYEITILADYMQDLNSLKYQFMMHDKKYWLINNNINSYNQNNDLTIYVNYDENISSETIITTADEIKFHKVNLTVNTTYKYFKTITVDNISNIKTHKFKFSFN